MKGETTIHRVAFGSDGRTAGAVYYTVGSTQDSRYGKRCAFCGYAATTGKVILEISFPGMFTPLVVCSKCVEQIHANMLLDISDERVSKIADSSPLVGWISEADASMESP